MSSRWIGPKPAVEVLAILIWGSHSSPVHLCRRTIVFWAVEYLAQSCLEIEDKG